jgi:hypothetical protein
MNQLELMAAGERPIVKGYTGLVGENFDIAHFDEPALDSAVSCLSAKYHSSDGQTPIDPDDELTWNIPGRGEKKDDCGDYLKAVGCPGHASPTVTGQKHDRKVILKHCFNPECPVCYPAWAVREGNAAADRMKAAERLYRAEGNDLQDARHFTFSPPQDAATLMIKTKKGYKQLKKYVIKLIKKSGILGGVVIFHAHRVNKFKQLYISPHFHVIAYGYVLDTVDFNKEFPGWIIKNMGKRASLAGTIIYALDHCGLGYETLPGTRFKIHAVTWFGLLSYNKVAKDSIIKSEKELPCKACSAAMHEYALVVNPDGHGMTPDWEDDKGIYFIKVKTVVYKLTNLVKKKPKKEPEKEYEQTRFERVL